MELMLVYLSTVSLAVTATLTLKAERRPVVTSFSIQMNLMNLIFVPVAYSDLSDMDSCCGYDTEDESKVITLTLVLYVVATALFKQPATVARWLSIRPDYQISVGVSSNSRYLTIGRKISRTAELGLGRQPALVASGSWKTSIVFWNLVVSCCNHHKTVSYTPTLYITKICFFDCPLKMNLNADGPCRLVDLNPTGNTPSNISVVHKAVAEVSRIGNL